MRSSRSPVLFPLRAAAVAYIDIFRGAPAILVILTLGFGMPALRLPGIPSSAIFWGTVACILTSSAYQSETFRAGIESVHASQRAAARSLGLTNFQSMRHVVLPQAIRTVIRDGHYLPPGVPHQEVMSRVSNGDSALHRLTRREREIFDLLIHGHSNDDIGARLFIARRTVETHRHRIMKKLATHSIIDMIRLAARQGALTG